MKAKYIDDGTISVNMCFGDAVALFNYLGDMLRAKDNETGMPMVEVDFRSALYEIPIFKAYIRQWKEDKWHW